MNTAALQKNAETATSPVAAKSNIKVSSDVEQVSKTKTLDVIESCIERYQAFMHTLNHLIIALKKHQAAMIQNRKARDEVVRQVTVWTRDTPLNSCIGEKTPPSLLSLNSALKKSTMSCEDEYEDKVIDYAIEWEKTVKAKFTSALKEYQDSRRVLNHYEKKMANLSANRDKVTAKGKELSPKAADKLERNQFKHERADHEYQKHRASVCHYVEKFVDPSWKDLIPLLAAFLQVDANGAEEKASFLGDFHAIMDKLSDVADENGLGPEGRVSTEPWRPSAAKLDACDSTATPDSLEAKHEVFKEQLDEVDIPVPEEVKEQLDEVDIPVPEEEEAVGSESFP